jgi:hypothetical protein
MIVIRKKLDFDVKQGGLIPIEEIKDYIIRCNDIGATHIKINSDEEGIFIQPYTIRPESILNNKIL